MRHIASNAQGAVDIYGRDLHGMVDPCNYPVTKEFLMTSIPDLRRLSHQIEQGFAALEAKASAGSVSTSGAQALAVLRANPQRAQGLGAVLGLEKSTVSRLVSGLLKAELIVEEPDPKDRRAKMLYLTEKGSDLTAQIATDLSAQLADFEQDGGAQGALASLSQVGRALGRDVPHDWKIETGPQSGAIGRLIELHGLVYGAEHGFDQKFEAFVARDLAELSPKLGEGKSQMWSAYLDGRMVGGICLDGDRLRLSRAEIRFLVVDQSARGLGLGKKLLNRAISFYRNKGFDELSLRTFEGLDMARALYEKAGFVLVEEHQGDTYGSRLTEQKFVLKT